MADELTLKFYLEFSKGGAVVTRTPATTTIDVSGDHYCANVQEVGTSAENLVQGEVGTPGYILAHNLDGTNFVEIGYDDTGFKPTVKLLAGEWALFRCTQATPQAKADTAACDLEYIIIEA